MIYFKVEQNDTLRNYSSGPIQIEVLTITYKSPSYILVWRQETPRWANDLVLQYEMLGQIQETPIWTDEPVWLIWRGLGNMEGLGKIHNNKRHSLGSKHSLTEVWNSTTS